MWCLIDFSINLNLQVLQTEQQNIEKNITIWFAIATIYPKQTLIIKIKYDLTNITLSKYYYKGNKYIIKEYTTQNTEANYCYKLK